MVSAIEAAHPLAELSFCVIDTETTGGHAAFDRVIDVAIFRLKNGEIQEKFQSLINPGRPIPPWITALTGIDDDMVKKAPTFAEIAGEVDAFLGRGVFTAHNAMFDYGFVQRELERHGRLLAGPQVCTLKLARQLLPELPSRSLGYLCEHLLIDIWDRHRAHGDAEATAYVLKNFLRDLDRAHNIRTWGELEAFQAMGFLNLPDGFNYRTVLDLPPVPGQYVFKDGSGSVVCQGKVKNVQRRVQTYFRRTNVTKKSELLRKTVKSIEVLPLLEN
jgi:DNA polymerase-3 subunit epsilon